MSYLKYVLSTAVVLSACTSQQVSQQKAINYRQPASSQELIDGSRKVLTDIGNPQIFNPKTCPTFIGSVTNYLYYLPADHFIPKTPEEVEQLKTVGPEVMETVFNIRVALHQKLQEFDAQKNLSVECVNKIREGFQYARFAEEYLFEWLVQNKKYNFKETLVMDNRRPNTWTNPEFAGFKLQSGDVLLIRGSSHVSAMIARIGDEEGNFSHLAIVGEDSKGELHIVESLIQYGTVVTPLEKWRRLEKVSRVALYRMPDTEMARKAARFMYDKAQAALDAGKGIRYDFYMDDDDYGDLFCSEVVRYAFDGVSKGRIMIPKFRSTLRKFKDKKYPESLGVTKKTLFAPYDIEVDPRFDFVAEHRYLPLLRQVRMQDAVLQSIYSWMIEKDYTFYWAPQHSAKAYLAKIIRQFGMVADTLPTYMPLQSIETNVKFEAVALTLQDNLYKKEAEFYKKHNYLPSFQDMIAMNEDYRKADCELHQKAIKSRDSVYTEEQNMSDTSKFHWFYHAQNHRCD